MVSLITVAGLVLLYCIGLAVYRLYLSPLAKFPGPKLAALTSLYCAYHDIYRGGQYIWVIRDMHREYGPVVRIMPGVLHINDPGFIDTLYSSVPSRRRERAPTFLRLSLENTSILFTADHGLHRRRRAAFAHFFSRQNVRRLVPVINGTVTGLLGRMDGWAAEGRPVPLNPAFQATTKDVIQNYALGDGRKCLEMEDLNRPFFDLLRSERMAYVTVHFQLFSRVMTQLPVSILMKLSPSIGAFIEFNKNLSDQLNRVRGEVETKGQGSTVFHEVLRSDLPESEKTTARLVEEASVLAIAGADTTAQTLTCLAYQVLSNRSIFERLRTELDSVMPDPSQPPNPVKLDSLPFLNALIEESLRFYPSATHRQDRLAPDEDLVYKYPDGRVAVIPAGTSVGMTAPLVNRSPLWYEDPDTFNPDRYLEDPKLMRRMLSFSKGLRQCIGINLAYQELQTITATIFRKYSPYDPTLEKQRGPTMELYKTTHREIEMYADYVTMYAYPGSQGLRVIIRNE